MLQRRNPYAKKSAAALPVQPAALRSYRSVLYDKVMDRKARRDGVEHLLRQVKRIISNIYGEQLVNVILYGSFARDTFRDDSDIDVAVILKGKVSKAKEIDRIYDCLYDLELETGELVSVNPISQDEYEGSRWPLFDHIKTEGVVV